MKHQYELFRFSNCGTNINIWSAFMNSTCTFLKCCKTTKQTQLFNYVTKRGRETGIVWSKQFLFLSEIKTENKMSTWYVTIQPTTTWGIQNEIKSCTTSQWKMFIAKHLNKLKMYLDFIFVTIIGILRKTASVNRTRKGRNLILKETISSMSFPKWNN